MNGSLTVIGTGIKFLSHLTNEAQTHINQSEKLLYLLNDPAMEQWLLQKKPQAESLEPLYTKYAERLECYQAITQYIVATVQQNMNVCVLLYGHPTIFAMPALNAAKQTKQLGYFTKILPGISAEDCLFADLMLDPGDHGCQSFEATDFLIYQRKFDPSSHLILWQIGILGKLEHVFEIDNQKNADVLSEYLQQWYPENHKVTLYEAAQYPGFEAKVEIIPLNNLPQAEFSRLSTLYIPPAKVAAINHDMLQKLNISKS